MWFDLSKCLVKPEQVQAPVTGIEYQQVSGFSVSRPVSYRPETCPDPTQSTPGPHPVSSFATVAPLSAPL